MVAARRHAGCLALLALSCAQRLDPPEPRPQEAAMGRCRAGIDSARACGDWSIAVAACQGDAESHTTFPELDRSACFIPVHHRPGGLPQADEIANGCGYPQARATTMLRIEREAARYQRIANGEATTLPMALDCGLAPEVLTSSARASSKTLRALSRRLASGGRFAYAAVSTFGFGHAAMGASELVSWRPGQACRSLDKRQMELLSVNRVRAGRAAAAYHGRVAPVITVSGGAVHAPLVEAFMLLHLLACQFDVPPEAVLLDPCADHTHTNIRNTGGLIAAIDGRAAYIVTDDGLQAGYLQDWTSLSLVGGSIDQRALRDWGYLLGSWRQASIGIDAGFWFTPYRFWGEPEQGLGTFTCAR